jgi:hypothetical protein
VTAPGLVYHRICDDKSARTFKSLLGNYEGWVVADALGTHQAGARDCRGVRLAACWAHYPVPAFIWSDIGMGGEFRAPRCSSSR